MPRSSLPAIILVVPVVMPRVHAAGIDPVHFGLVVTDLPVIPMSLVELFYR